MLSVDITKKYHGFTLRAVFNAGNETLALLGPSGGGKTVTLKCVAGIIKPDAGRIVLDGRVLFDSAAGVNVAPQKRRTGLLFQNYALVPTMTVAQNIALGMRRACVPDKKRRLASLASLMEAFHLTGQAGHYPAQLSGGQQQRAALARILASDPALLMLDEPLSALDFDLRERIEQELRGVMEAFSGTVLYVSHNRDEVYRLCGKVCVIQGGQTGAVTGADTFYERSAEYGLHLCLSPQLYRKAARAAADLHTSVGGLIEDALAEKVAQAEAPAKGGVPFKASVGRPQADPTLLFYIIRWVLTYNKKWWII